MKLDRVHIADVTERRLRFTPFNEVRPSTGARYLVKGILPNTGLVVAWGPPKCGKSFWVFDLVAHVAAGWEYRGRRVKQCPVAYFALEGQEGFTARIEAFRQEHAVTRIPFHLCADRITLPKDGTAVVQSIRGHFGELMPGIVVLDTLNRSIDGSENDPSDMGGYVRAADLIRETFDCVVIVIHHCGVEGVRPRGHTSLTGAADAQIAVRRDAANSIVAAIEYMKDGPAGDEIVSTLTPVVVGTDDDGEEITSCIVKATESRAGRPAKDNLSPTRKAALHALFECVADGESPPPSGSNGHVPPGSKGVTLGVWKRRLEQHAIINPKGSPREQFRRIHVTLRNAAKIGIWEDFVWPVT